MTSPKRPLFNRLSHVAAASFDASTPGAHVRKGLVFSKQNILDEWNGRDRENHDCLQSQSHFDKSKHPWDDLLFLSSC
jgi:hypothetical protein